MIKMNSKRSISQPKTAETNRFPELCKFWMILKITDIIKSAARNGLTALNASRDDTNRLNDLMNRNAVTEHVKVLLENATEGFDGNNNYLENGKCYDRYGHFLLQCGNINERNYTEAFDAFVKSSESYEKGNDYRSAISAMGVALSVHEKDLKMDRTGKINYQNTAILSSCYKRLKNLYRQALDQCKHSEYDELMIRNYKYLCHAINGEKSNKEKSVNDGVGDTHDTCDLSKGIREENENEVLNDITDYSDYGDETQVNCESSCDSDATEIYQNPFEMSNDSGVNVRNSNLCSVNNNSGLVSNRFGSVNPKKIKRLSRTKPNERLIQLTKDRIVHHYVIDSQSPVTHLECQLCSVSIKSERYSVVKGHLISGKHQQNCNSGKRLKMNTKRKIDRQKITGHTNGTNLNSLVSSSNSQITSLEMAAKCSGVNHVPSSTAVHTADGNSTLSYQLPNVMTLLNSSGINLSNTNETINSGDNRRSSDMYYGVISDNNDLNVSSHGYGNVFDGQNLIQPMMSAQEPVMVNGNDQFVTNDINLNAGSMQFNPNQYINLSPLPVNTPFEDYQIERDILSDAMDSSQIDNDYNFV